MTLPLPAILLMVPWILPLERMDYLQVIFLQARTFFTSTVIQGNKIIAAGYVLSDT